MKVSLSYRVIGFSAYRGCFSMSDLPTSTSPSYDSPEHMTIGFCVQVCLGAASDPETKPEFLGVMVSLSLENLLLQHQLTGLSYIT